MTSEELIESLTILKEQAQHYGDNTFVWSINIDSFKFVIDHTIKALEQEPVLEKINKMKLEIADSLEFWDYSPNNNPLARDMLETLTNFWGDIREVKE